MKNLHCCTFIIVFSLFFPFFSVAIDTISPTKPLAGNQTLVSNGEVFEMGFFNRGNGNLYLGIWYKNVEMKEYVWVANRDAPINSSAGKLTIEENGKLVVVDQSETAVWWTNQSAPAVENMVGQLLDNGNFVVRRENDDDEKNYIWQSFDFPTDTLLPEMKIGWSRRTGVNRFLQSWKTATDPGSGEYSFKMNTDGFPEVFLLSMETPTYRSGPWNGRRFSGVPEMVTANLIEFEFENNSEEITYSFEMRNTSVYSRLIMNSSGLLQRFTWVETSKTWSNYWFAPRDQCDYYGECGPFGICDSNLSPVCKCPKGFRPKNQQAWDLRDGSGGCVRSSELDCGSDGFLPLKNMKLPVSSKAFVDRSMNLSRCEEICKRNCACAAYANMDITSGGSGCVIWAVDLFDMRQYADTENGGQDLYVRVAASDLDKPSTAGSSKSGSDNNVAMIVGITVGACAVLIILLILVYLRRKKLRRLNNSKIDKRGPLERSQDFLMNEGIILSSKKDYSGETTTDELELPLFEFTTLVMATNNFSDANKLGQGGFGCVYKGKLMEGEVVAIKRLSRTSGQGIEELKNEVRLIAKLQHRNLVRLLGCCIEVEEKLLIYEYMENKSLNTFLFNKEKSPLLNWQRRFDIISGIARGLLYLHQDSRFRIIHRDLKASNILLDREMNPKISDFGMARIFGSDQTEAETKKVVGTHGYMSPEYAMDGLFSIKSDVFSFGVLVLEIVSGKKNRGFYYADNQLNLLGHTWKLWNEGRGLELLDESVGAKFSKDEVLRCIQIGLLCIQEQADDRPNMSKVLLMLSSEVVQLAQPKYPGFCLGKRHFEAESSSKQDESMTVNEITVTILDGR
ncbi:receptor-like serine/threonine-protein kinase SD1-8 [Cynara cardunculus var. scolymus]|uniref:receptor-like serine/threonine-protein kinase SD1-8 n=1 Tax=Cynara cardunculus var. scolymus TaxID=59895 RepID=UPI000D62440C|nr:receptor-like serine/threonine-protein kinase SD1-8 [Cynara cardunculus var. scolymus]